MREEERESQNQNLMSTWISMIHILVVILFTIIFIIVSTLNSSILIYAVGVINIAVWAAIITRFKRILENLFEQKNSWELAATYDSLTGIYNRGIFTQNLEKEIQRSTRHNLDMSFVVFDLDKFKNINDIYKHTTGDEVLVRVCSKIKETIRSIDMIGRLGGEEFGVLLPETSCDSAEKTCERMRKAVETINIPEFPDLNVTISIGVTSLRKNEKFDSVYERADGAMLEAKALGRNRVKAVC